MKTLILFPLGMIIVIYLWVGQILPLNKERVAVAASNALLVDTLAAQQAKIDEITTFIGNTNKYPEEVDFLNRYVPRTPREQDTINFFSRATSERNLQIYGLTFGELAEGDERAMLSSATVNAQIAGTYSDLFDFVQDVFLTRQLYTLDSAIFEKTDDEGDSDFLTLNIAFTYYFLGDDIALSPEQSFGRLSFDRVRAFSDALKTVREIDQTDAPQRYNPFVP